MSYSILAFFSVLTLSLVHLWAEKAQKLDAISHGRFLSAGGGTAIAFVFLNLLPKLSKSDQLLTQSLSGLFPYFERHGYILALLGFLLFYVVHKSPPLLQKQAAFFLSMGSYMLLNFLIGYAIVDPNNLEVRPLMLFTFAIGLHYFINDYSLNKKHGERYSRLEKWMLIVSLWLGWLASFCLTLSTAAVALVSAFIGGIIMNVMRHELAEDNHHSLGAFVVAAILYAGLLLSIG
jgi:hypothetical protein